MTSGCHASLRWYDIRVHRATLGRTLRRQLLETGERMKALRIFLCGLLMFALQSALANGDTSVLPKDEPYYGKKMAPAIKHAPNHDMGSRNGKKAPQTAKKITRIPRLYRSLDDRMLVVTLYPGSLKANIVRIARNCGWNNVIWNVPEDYVWVGHTQIVGPDLYNVLFRILAKYPVQAQLYQGNRVLAIVPRNLP